MAPFEGMVNRGIRRALGLTGLREVTSPFLGSSSSVPPRLSLPAANETALAACPRLLHPPPSATTDFICSHLCLSTSLSLSILSLFQLSQGHLSLRSLLSSRPIDGCLSLPMQPASAPGRERSRCLSVSLHL